VRNVRVDFRGLAALVAQQFLNVAQVYAFFQQVCSKGMPEGCTVALGFTPDLILANVKIFCTLRSLYCPLVCGTAW